jgi:putative N6-adenine-specific DNA methylase
MPSPPTDERFDCFAPTAPGLEAIAARELKARGRKPRKELGGVAFRATSRDLYESNLWLRTASRVLVRLGGFHAATFHELERRANKIEWSRFLPREGTVAVRVTTRKSRLYHSDAVAERVLGAIARAAPPSLHVKAEQCADDDPDQSDVDPAATSQLFVVRILHDECEVSADSSGALLHRRGYRQEVAKAPLRETLAGAMVLASGWLPTETLLDPLCGSGTIPIEAAMVANNIAPGMRREFAFMRWPSFDRSVWDSALGDARAIAESVAESREKRGRTEVIVGSDRDAGAIAAAERNAERAGVAGLISWREAPLSESMADMSNSEPGWLLANPPYGIRVGDPSSLRNLYSSLGRLSKMRPAWRTGVLTAERTLAGHLGIPLRERFATRNGGIPVSFFVSSNVKTAGPE